jgi:hypothetical protein
MTVTHSTVLTLLVAIDISKHRHEVLIGVPDFATEPGKALKHGEPALRAVLVRIKEMSPVAGGRLLRRGFRRNAWKAPRRCLPLMQVYATLSGAIWRMVRAR